MKSALIMAIAVVASLAGTTPVASEPSSEYVFSTKDNNALAGNHRKLRWSSRQTTVAATRKFTKKEEKLKQMQREAALATEQLDGEDNIFWNRLLDEAFSMVPSVPTDARPTGPPPTVPAPIVPATTAPEPTAPPPAPTAPPPAPTPPSPAPTPARCPVTIDISCVTLDGSRTCTNIEPPASGAGQGCTVEVEYGYTMTNNGNEIARIYSLVIKRGGEATDITNTFPVTNMRPGEPTIILQNAFIDVCQGGDGAFITEAGLVTGPPSDILVTIACESEEGDECRKLPQAASPDQCTIQITYTYTVTNSGIVDANIILFTRTRNGEFRDLISLLDSTYLPIGDATSVQESEEIDRCVQQSFATNTIVAQIPNADLLCEDVAFYPNF